MKERLQRIKRGFLFLFFALSLGGMAGGIVWVFLLLMNGGLFLLWDFIPSIVSVPWYPVVCCGIGGVLIGIWQKRFGPYPESLMTVMNRISTEHHVNYDNLFAILVAALLPLVFGGSIGPEAGLTGAIAGLCYWIGDHLHYAARDVRELEKVGVSATLGVIFGAAPLLGLFSPLELSSGDTQQRAIPKDKKLLLYCMAILGSIGVFSLLNLLIPGSGLGLPRLEAPALSGVSEFLWMLPAAAIGILCGVLYQLSGTGVHLFLRLFGNHTVWKGICCGLLLGGCGICLPYTMFSGETQMEILSESFLQMGWLTLLLTGVLKLVVGQLCVQSGWRGGNIFPLVFSGISVGLASSFLIPASPMLLAAVTTASLCGYVLKKPILVILVLLLCFPISSIVILTLGAVLGGLLPRLFRLPEPAPH